MATATVEPQAEQKATLKKNISLIRGKIESAQSDERAWREKLDAKIAALGDLRKKYEADCRAVAAGRNGDPSSLREEVSTAEDVIAAAKKILAEKEAVITTLFAQLSSEQDALSVIEQHENEAAESRQLQEKFEQGKAAIAARDNAQAEDCEIEFRVKDKIQKCWVKFSYRPEEFVALLAEHVPDHYRHAIRYFGLLAPRTKGQISAAVFLLLGQRRQSRPRRLSWAFSLQRDFGRNPLVDRNGHTMRWIGRLKPST